MTCILFLKKFPYSDVVTFGKDGEKISQDVLIKYYKCYIECDHHHHHYYLRSIKSSEPFLCVLLQSVEFLFIPRAFFSIFYKNTFLGCRTVSKKKKKQFGKISSKTIYNCKKQIYMLLRFQERMVTTKVVRVAIWNQCWLFTMLVPILHMLYCL